MFWSLQEIRHRSKLKPLRLVRRLPHPSGNRYRLVFVFSTPEDNFAGSSLCDQHLPAFTDMYRNMFDRVVNGPGFLDMRGVDAKMYLVLSMRAFNRGPPMIPHDNPCSEESFNMSAGEHLGLVSWTRFKPDENSTWVSTCGSSCSDWGTNWRSMGSWMVVSLSPTSVSLCSRSGTSREHLSMKLSRCRKQLTAVPMGDPKTRTWLKLGRVSNAVSHTHIHVYIRAHTHYI